MAIRYNLDNKFEDVAALLTGYEAWFFEVLQHKFYGAEQPAEPAAFIDWIGERSISEINIDGRYLDECDRLKNHHNEVIKVAQSLSNPPSDNEFESFSSSFKTLTASLRKFCQAIVLEEWGLDVLTGLKNNAIVQSDLEIEMERLSREGYPFCIGLAKIDGFEEIDATLSEEEADTIIKKTAGLLLQSLRSYDDAYRISRDHFIMCIKQADIVGGQKALARLRDIMEEANERYTISGEEKLLSLSCCVAAPLPGDEIKDLLDNLFMDLDKEVTDHGSVLAYQELSPLQRFIKQEEE